MLSSPATSKECVGGLGLLFTSHTSYYILEHTLNVEIRGPVLTLLIKPLYYSNLVLVL